MEDEGFEDWGWTNTQQLLTWRTQIHPSTHQYLLCPALWLTQTLEHIRPEHVSPGHCAANTRQNNHPHSSWSHQFLQCCIWTVAPSHSPKTVKHSLPPQNQKFWQGSTETSPSRDKKRQLFNFRPMLTLCGESHEPLEASEPTRKHSLDDRISRRWEMQLQPNVLIGQRDKRQPMTRNAGSASEERNFHRGRSAGQAGPTGPVAAAAAAAVIHFYTGTLIFKPASCNVWRVKCHYINLQRTEL